MQLRNKLRSIQLAWPQYDFTAPALDTKEPHSMTKAYGEVLRGIRTGPCST
ncbi:hypothetical protein [Streptomyces sp. NPDC055189]